MIIRLLPFPLLLAICLFLPVPSVFGKAPASATDTAKTSAPESGETVFTKAVPETVDDLIAIEEQSKKIAKKVTRFTVGVRIGRARGSGVIVSKDGYILTAAHVVGAAGRSAIITLADGHQVKATTLGMHREGDAALMKIDEKGDWPAAEMGDVKGIKPGTWCLALGHPGGARIGRPPVLRLGRVVLIRGGIIQTDCTLVGGDSGGPLFDMDGRVIGIHSRIGNSTDWNFHVPISVYRAGWDRMAASEVFGQPPSRSGGFLGVGGDDHPQGCKITSVGAGLPAEKAGLQVDDVITKIDGKEIKGFEDLARVVSSKKPGETVKIEVLRDGKQVTMTAELTKRES